MTVNCSLCGQPVETERLGTYRRTTGWVEKRSSGGGNAIKLPTLHDEWAHGYCVERESLGIAARQGSLLG